MDKRLILASPTYGFIYPDSEKSIRQAMMMHGLVWADDVSVDRMYIANSRETMFERALMAKDWDGVIWVDADMIIPRVGIHRLVYHDLDLVGGLYFQRRPPFWPMIEKDTGTGCERISEYPDDALFPVDSVGFGFVYTSKKLLQDMGKEYLHPFGTGAGAGEDFTFCRKARQLGYQPYVDTGLRCGHIGEHQIVTQETFLREHGRYQASGTLPPDRNPK